MNADSDPLVSTPTGKINYGQAGLGTVSPEMVEERAAELARIDGRAEVNPGDRQAAREELAGVEPPEAPETGNSPTKDLTTWDEVPEASGTQAARVAPDDEATIGEILVEEGLDEADHDQRLNATKEDPLEER